MTAGPANSEDMSKLVGNRKMRAFQVTIVSISTTVLLLFLLSGCMYTRERTPQNIESIYVLQEPRDPLGQLQYEAGEEIRARTVTVISDTLLGVGTWSEDVFFVDVSDPETPTIVSAFRTRVLSPGIVAAMDSFVYVDGSPGIEVIDISDPARPRSANFISRRVDSLAGEAGYLYMAHRAGDPFVPIAIEIWDATNPPTLTLASTYALPQFRASRENIPEYLRATPRQQEAERALYSGPLAMSEMPEMHFCRPGLISSADIESGLLYVSTTVMSCRNKEDTIHQGHPGGLWVLDVTDPAAPLAVGFMDQEFLGYSSHEVKVVGAYAYLASSLEGLVVVDVSDPTQPLFVSTYYTGELVWEVDVKDNIAYIGDIFRLHVLDVGKPAEPVRIGFMPRFFDIDDITVHAGLIYLAGIHKGFPPAMDPDPLSHVRGGLHVLRLMDNGVRQFDR